MSTNPRYLFIAAMNVAAEQEALFQDVYDAEHVPYLSSVPGVGAVTRYRTVDLAAIVGEDGPIKSAPDEPRYTAIYELESPEILAGEDWNRMIEKGRWPTEVRPYTADRRHVLLERLDLDGGK
ncbi:MAG: hypothetical protein QM729_05980 [Solirubrobacterales bacterium]